MLGDDASAFTMCGSSTMGVIRYKRHFLMLMPAAFLFWLARTITVPHWMDEFIFYFGLMGVLHATSLVLSLRHHTARAALIGCAFITLAALWSVLTPILGMICPLPGQPGSQFKFISLFVVGSAVGSSGYFVLVRHFWLQSLRLTDGMRTVSLCVAATLLSSVAPEALNPGGDPWPFITAAWWFAFSLSLYSSRVIGHVNERGKAIENIR
jgi:uncharacterized membrane protein